MPAWAGVSRSKFSAVMVLEVRIAGGIPGGTSGGAIRHTACEYGLDRINVKRRETVAKYRSAATGAAGDDICNAARRAARIARKPEARGAGHQDAATVTGNGVAVDIGAGAFGQGDTGVRGNNCGAANIGTRGLADDDSGIAVIPWRRWLGSLDGATLDHDIARLGNQNCPGLVVGDVGIPQITAPATGDDDTVSPAGDRQVPQTKPPADGYRVGAIVGGDD
jgi:hypothetical protein